MSYRSLFAMSAGAAMLAMSVPQVTIAATLTATSWGGAYSMSQRKAFYEPFMKETGNVVLEDEWDGSLSIVRAMVETGNYKSHVIDATPAFTTALCDDGVIERIDWKKLGLTPDDFLPGGAQECGVGTIAFSTVFAYRTDVYPNDPPKNWADFWDLKKYPGKRSLYKSEPVGSLEFALIADGVPTDQVYDVLKAPGGIDRAFKKLDEIKADTIWWATGAEAPQLLADKEVVMASGWNGRFYSAVVEDGQPFKMVWDGQMLDYDFWVIPAGHPEKDLAYEFLAFASRPDRQGDQTNYISYGPLRKGAEKFVNPEILPHLPTAPQNRKNGFRNDTQFWADHTDELKSRFASWLAR